MQRASGTYCIRVLLDVSISYLEFTRWVSSIFGIGTKVSLSRPLASTQMFVHLQLFFSRTWRNLLNWRILVEGLLRLYLVVVFIHVTVDLFQVLGDCKYPQNSSYLTPKRARGKLNKVSFHPFVSALCWFIFLSHVH